MLRLCHLSMNTVLCQRVLQHQRAVIQWYSAVSTTSLCVSSVCSCKNPGHTHLMICFMSTATLTFANSTYKCKLVGVATYCVQAHSSWKERKQIMQLIETIWWRSQRPIICFLCLPEGHTWGCTSNKTSKGELVNVLGMYHAGPLWFSSCS